LSAFNHWARAVIAKRSAPRSTPNRLDRRSVLASLATLPAWPGLIGTAAAQAQTAPLASWIDGPARRAILEFVRVTTDQASPGFVPPEERIATFDQDGTLWVEQPAYAQLIYCNCSLRSER
jgi:hypothetical protein